MNGENVKKEYMTLSELSDYSGISIKSLRLYINSNRIESLPHFRIGTRGKILVKVNDFNQWMEQYKVGITKDTSGLVSSMVESIYQDILNKNKN